MYYFDKKQLKDFDFGDSRCFTLTNGLGGYCTHSIINSSHRKHYGYLIACLKSPVIRKLILTRIDESVQIGDNFYDLQAQNYKDYKKNGNVYLNSFSLDYIPTFIYQINNLFIKKRISLKYNSNSVAISYEIKSDVDCSIYLKPLFNYNDHGEASTIDDLKFYCLFSKNKITLIPKRDCKVKIKFYYSKGSIIKNINEYSDGFKCLYDFNNGDERLHYHYNPVNIKIDVKANKVEYVSVVCSIDNIKNINAFNIIDDYQKRINRLIKQSKMTDPLAKDLVVSADNFICKRSSTNLKTILAGLPWFTDWGRDSMIAFTGLTLVTRRFKEAKEILKSFSLYEKNGLIPNMFPDDGASPLYNTVDASLWYFYAVYKYIEYTKDFEFIKNEIYPTLKNIIKYYSTHTDFSIYMDDDYLIHAGSGLNQITWMDVRINDIVVTPRHGKPCEINALWYNALMIMKMLAKEFNDDYNYYGNLAINVKKSFEEKFFCKESNCLYDVIEPNDNSIRPNQIYAISLPFKLLDLGKAKSVFEVVEKQLYNKYGLRSLSINDPRFKSKYEGKLFDRDMAYHMGTTWVFLIGPYLDAHKYIYNDVDKINELVHVFITHLNDGCINGVAEIFDGDIANKTKGCYTQAWSVGELLRAYYENVLKK